MCEKREQKQKGEFGPSTFLFVALGPQPFVIVWEVIFLKFEHLKYPSYPSFKTSYLF